MIAAIELKLPTLLLSRCPGGILESSFASKQANNLSDEDRIKMLIPQIKQTGRSLVNRLRRQFSGQPQGFYPSVRDWVMQQSERRSPPAYCEIYPSLPVQRTLPQTIDPEMYWKFCLDYGQPAAAFAATVPQGRLWENTAVMTADRRLLSDVSVVVRVDPKHPARHPVFHSQLPALQKLPGTVAVLATMGGNSYFHWLVDLLPRLDLLQKSPYWQEIDYFFVNGNHHAFQQETLKILGIPLEKTMTAIDYPHLQADRLIVTSHPRQGTCAIGRWVFEFLRERLLAPVLIAANSGVDATATSLSVLPKRIYVSRNQASHRRVINETEIVNFLEKYGFKQIFLEELSIAQQIQQFAAAESIIAPHGAGLTNLVFSAPGTKVIEIYSPNYVSVSYWNISTQLGFDYFYLFGSGDRPAPHTDPHALREDILVDLPSLQQTMAKAGMI